MLQRRASGRSSGADAPNSTEAAGPVNQGWPFRCTEKERRAFAAAPRIAIRGKRGSDSSRNVTQGQRLRQSFNAWNISVAVIVTVSPLWMAVNDV